MELCKFKPLLRTINSTLLIATFTMEFIESIRNIDAYAKTSKKVKRKTVTGALGILHCSTAYLFSNNRECSCLHHFSAF